MVLVSEPVDVPGAPSSFGRTYKLKTPPMYQIRDGVSGKDPEMPMTGAE